MIATGEERADGNEDKGSRRRPAGSEVHLRYHLPVFSSRYAYARAYDSKEELRQSLAGYRVDFLPVVVAAIFTFMQKVTGTANIFVKPEIRIGALFLKKKLRRRVIKAGGQEVRLTPFSTGEDPSRRRREEDSTMDMSEDCWDHVGLLQEVSAAEPPPPPPASDFLIHHQELGMNERIGKFKKKISVASARQRRVQGLGLRFLYAPPVFLSFVRRRFLEAPAPSPPRSELGFTSDTGCPSWHPSFRRAVIREEKRRPGRENQSDRACGLPGTFVSDERSVDTRRGRTQA
ncbi:hypothetical protein G5I_07026 [Acromyrmex echinatior]|uniref:Uncharacterized protein n=1 Tax=Acromyrmex echinatior TaxID=103372 RepID=F4WMP2_ACREC|nr:hypothetical protein G5I_07026 [Acromyrmex echinatior]